MTENTQGLGPPKHRAHLFESASFGLIPTQCVVCSDFVNGFWQEASECRKCAISVHTSCIALYTQACTVPHQFAIEGTDTGSCCAVCGQTIVALWAKSYKCLDCGIQVHPQCRSQSQTLNCKAEDDNGVPPLESNKSGRNSRRVSFGRASLNQVTLPASRPTDFESVKKEIHQLHRERLSFSKELKERWVKTLKPNLKTQSNQLQQSLDSLTTTLRQRQDELSVLSAKRDKSLELFLTAFYQKYNPKKMKVVGTMVHHYASGNCLERDLFSTLLQKYSKEPTAVAMIEHERDFGQHTDGSLEEGLIQLESLHVEVSRTRSALAAITRDMHFPPHVRWLIKGGAENVYLGCSSLWVEECYGWFSLNVSVGKSTGVNGRQQGKKTDETRPAPTEKDDGYRPRICMQLTGVEDSTEPGWSFSARVEDFCLLGSALPFGLSLRDADIYVRFDVSMMAEYEPASGPESLGGTWRVLDEGFVLKSYKFTVRSLNTTSALSIPDLVLRTVLQTAISSTFKKIVVGVLPPELGAYMMAIHQHRVHKRNQGHTDVDADPDHIWRSPSYADKLEDRFLHLKALINIKQTVELETVDVSITERGLSNTDESKLVAKAIQALHMEPEQFRLLLLTQKELGLTWGELWGDTTSTDWLTTLATTVTGSGPDLGRIPLQSLMDLIKYFRDFLDTSPPHHSKTIDTKDFDESQRIASRLIHLWQLATDIVCERSGGEMGSTSIGGMMRKMVTRGLSSTSLKVKAFDWNKLTILLGQHARQEIHTQIDVSEFEFTAAIRGLVRCLRDAGLRMTGKKMSSAVMRNLSRLPRSKQGTASKSGESHSRGTESGGHGDGSIDGDKDEDGFGRTFARAIELEHKDNEASFELDFGKSLPVKIQRISDYALDKLKEVQERYLDSYRSRMELVAGDGVFRSIQSDIRLVAPVDVGWQLGNSLFENLMSRTLKVGNEAGINKWNWSRKMTIDEGCIKVMMIPGPDTSLPQNSPPASTGIVEEAWKRLGGRVPSPDNNHVNLPKPETHLEWKVTGFFAQMRTEVAALADVISLQVKPLTEPNRLEIKAVGANSMRIHISVDRYENHGKFALYFKYLDDLIAWNAKRSRGLEGLRAFVKFVASFAARDTFYIDNLSHLVIKSDISAGDIVIHNENHPGRRCVKIDLKHYATDVLRDLIDFVESAAAVSGTSPSPK